MNTGIRKTQQRARQYWFIDGLAELAAGTIALFLAAGYWATQFAPLSHWSLLIFLLAGLGIAFGIRLVIQKIKERQTYPRTGYAAPLKGWENKRVVMAVVVFVILLIVVQILLNQQGNLSLQWSPAISGFIFTFMFGLAAYQTGLNRFYLLAAFDALIGIGLAIAGLGYMPGVSILSMLTGLWLLSAGSWVRWNYLRQNPSQPKGLNG
jgi:MFS family permease